MNYSLLAGTSWVVDPNGVNFDPSAPSAYASTYQAWLAVGNTPTPAPTPAPVMPQQITDRQFWQACAQLGIIQQSDALAMMQTGVIPTVLLTAIGTLPAADQFAAKMTIIGERTFQRTDALLLTLAAAMSETSAQLDALFTLAATL